jgi:hypothetical protein
MKPAAFSTALLPHDALCIAALAIVAGVLSVANDAAADIIHNGSPSFSQTDDFFGTYSFLPNADPNGGGFFLIQNAAVPGYYDFDEDEFVDDQFAYSFLSSFSESHFSFAAFDDVVDSSLVPSINTGLAPINGTYYVAFDVQDALNGNAVYYGWMNVTASGIDTMDPIVFTLNEWAYDDTGATIKVGQVSAVPEPSTYCMALAGAAYGYSLFRRRKRA